MRAGAIALLAALGASLAVPAEARVFTDAQGRWIADMPNAYRQDDQLVRSDAEVSYSMFFTASNDCYVVGFPNEQTVNNTAFEIRRYISDVANFGADRWVSIANGITAVFPGDSAQFVSSSVDTTNFWPIQRGVLRNPTGPVHGAIQLRPGIDIVAFCTNVDGDAGAAAYDAVFRGISTARDAEWQAQATQQETDYNANQAAAAAAAAAQAEQPANNNRRRDPDE